jgi:drug/metabolite transporter (DMT)-like permease
MSCPGPCSSSGPWPGTSFAEDAPVKLNYYSVGYFILAVVSGIAYGFAGTILKKSAVDLKLTGGIFAIVKEVLTSKFVIISLFFSGTGYLIYMFIIRRAEIITTTLIIQGVLFVATMIFAALLFKEAITLTKIVALLLITAGIAVLLSGK